MITQFSSFKHIDRTPLGATTPGWSGPWSDNNKGVFRIPQSFSITGASPSDCLVSYLGYSLAESYPSVEMRSVYSADPADWASTKRVLSKIRNYIRCWVSSSGHLEIVEYSFIFITPRSTLSRCSKFQLICFKIISLLSLLYSYINLFELFNAKNILVEEQELYYLTHSRGYNKVHTVPKVFSQNC